jgi:ribonuclease P protein component
MENRKTFRKIEHLCLDKQIDGLFAHGMWLRSQHLKFVFRHVDTPLPARVQVLFSAPKKLHRRAVKRNLLKRRMREAYRNNKDILVSLTDEKNMYFILGFVYSREDIIDYKTIEKEIRLLLSQLSLRIEKGHLRN